MNIFANVFAVQILNIKRRSKVGSEIVGSPCLDGTSILHHRFDGVGIDGSGKFLGWCFLANDDRNRQVVFHEIAVSFQHPHRFFARFLLIFMRGMAFLP
ncbi:hypothetical protein D3C81_1624030 [compost metagenome]